MESGAGKSNSISILVDLSSAALGSSFFGDLGSDFLVPDLSVCGCDACSLPLPPSEHQNQDSVRITLHNQSRSLIEV